MRVIPIKIQPTTVENRVRSYLGILYKFHKLTNKELDVVVELIIKYYDIINKYPVHDKELVSKMLFDVSVKRMIKEKHHIQDAVLQNYMTVFRKKGVIVDGLLNPNYIPPLEPFEIKIEFP
jgi:hypothetical protein